VRASALGALARIGALEPFEVSAAMADPAPEVRRRACDLAGRLQIVELAPQLTEALSDDAAIVTEAACYALGELGGLCSEGTSSEEVPSEGSSMEGLSGPGPTREGPGREGLGKAGLGKAGRSRGVMAGEAAAVAVAALRVTATSHPEPLCREAAVAALGSLRSPAGLRAVLAALDDKPAIRRRAAVALAGFEGPEVEEALARAAEDVDWQVRQVAEDLRGYRHRPRRE
jgi:HEAT repeat protein